MPGYKLPKLQTSQSGRGALQHVRLIPNQADTVTEMAERLVDATSSLLVAPTEFDRYLYREMLRTPDLHDLVGQTMTQAAHAKFNTIPDDTAPLEVRHSVASDYAYAKSGTPAVLLDLYRMLKQPDLATDYLMKDKTFAGQMLSSVAASPRFEQITKTVNGDDVAAIRSAMYLLNSILQNLASADAQDAVDKQEQQEQQEPTDAGEAPPEGGGDTESEDGDSGAGDTQDGDSEGGDTQGGDSEGEQQASADDAGEAQGSGSGSSNELEQASSTGDPSASDGASESETEAGDTGSQADGGDVGTEEQVEQPPQKDAFEDAVSHAAVALNREQKTKQGKEATDAASMERLVSELSNTAGSPVGNGDDISKITIKVQEAIQNMYGRYATSLTNLYKIMGRTDAILGEAQTSSRHGDGEVVDVILSGDTSRMLASEYVALACDDLEPLYYSRMAEEQLLTSQRTGVDDGGNGPIIILVDASGSTSACAQVDNVKATILDVEFGLTLSLVKYARKWHRPVVVIPFDSDIRDYAIFVNGVYGAPSTSSAVHTALRHCISQEAGGGTNFMRALQQTVQYMKKLPETFEQADIIYLTDGDDYGAARTGNNRVQIDNLLADSGVRLFVLAIKSAGYRNTKIATVEKQLANFFHSVAVCRVTELDDGISRLFKSIVTDSYYSIGGQVV